MTRTWVVSPTTTPVLLSVLGPLGRLRDVALAVVLDEPTHRALRVETQLDPDVAPEAGTTSLRLNGIPVWSTGLPVPTRQLLQADGTLVDLRIGEGPS